MEAGGEVQGHPQWQGKFEANLNYNETLSQKINMKI